ncbi:type II toxin-antitoxin system RelB/DinJ family antitoxin [Oribacterium sinus]|uniref:type II toxin-antitoxin system RelB/DinJ family antitoxin n=1 Tax=Oribacterium sinus TaxID=237576 RepID=UPI0028E6211B|nr:type II toxin-antitoxin system RelB/DinJ family antitoxin [Oribacterium sinus]
MAITKTASVNVRIEENVKNQAENILETLGIPRATAIDMFYRQIILNNGLPFSLTVPKAIPIREEMSKDAFHAMMTTGYSQALKDDSQPMDEVFKELEEGL